MTPRTCTCGVAITADDGWNLCDFCADRLRGEIAEARWDEFWGEVAPS